jgi:uncharacterized membrane protein required for colicin V production
MQIMYLIPWLDIFLVLLFLGLIALGFWQGMLKELWFLLSLYLSAVLGSLVGDRIGGFLQRSLAVAEPEVASTWGFLIMITLGTIIIYSVLYSLFGHAKLPPRLLPLDKIVGVTLGLLTSFALTSFIAFALNALVPLGPTEWAFTDALKVQQETAAPILRLFLGARPVIMATLQVWLPSGLDLPYFMRL